MTYSEIIFNRPDLKDELNELAGKYEFMGNYTRDAAEEQTAKVISERYVLFVQHDLFDS